MKNQLTGLREALKAGEVKIKFTKVDGTVREMRASLNEGLVPMTIEDPTKPKKERKINEDVMKVYDTENEGWRSFRKDALISWSVSSL